MFELFEKVFIKEKNLPGTIVHICDEDDEKIYVVESDIEGKRDDGYGGIWPLFDCHENELAKI